MKKEAETYGYVFPYLLDETQDGGRRLHGYVHPRLLLVRADRRWSTGDALDDSRPDSGIPVTGKEPRAAMDAVHRRRSRSPVDQYASMGCSIKWAEGRQPAYFG